MKLSFYPCHIAAAIFATSFAAGCGGDDYLNHRVEELEEGEWVSAGAGCILLMRGGASTGGGHDEAYDPGAAGSEGSFSISETSARGKITVTVEAGADSKVREFDRTSLRTGEETVIKVTDADGQKHRVTLWGDIECDEELFEE